MAISEFENKRIEKIMDAFLVKRRPAVHLRQEMDFDYRITDQSVEFYEVRPEWKNKENTIEIPVAKATYVKSKKLWKIFWLRSDMKWHPYEPATVKHLEDFVAAIETDEFGCFFG